MKINYYSYLALKRYLTTKLNFNIDGILYWYIKNIFLVLKNKLLSLFILPIILSAIFNTNKIINKIFEPKNQFLPFNFC
jgi:hypothetical protein